MRFSVFLPQTSKWKHANTSPVHVTTCTFGNWTEWFDACIAMAYNLICKKKVKKGNTADGSTTLIFSASSVRPCAWDTRHQMLHWGMLVNQLDKFSVFSIETLLLHGIVTELLLPPTFMENRQSVTSFPGFTMQICIHMLHGSRHVAIHFFASHTAYSSEPKTGRKESRSHNYYMLDLLLPHTA